ncbi:hypothetical protein E4T44_01419 [Aureobasidium sp. EXF-8845]|nr:hypothetical protein E4T44_01419 [Aureobasidium sp. EXF-8845]
MREKGFDQLPVSAGTGSRLVGLVTLGNLLSYLSSGRATGHSRVSDVMFDFRKIDEVVSSPHDISIKTPEERKKAATSSETESHPERRQFVEITKDTKLSALSRFFEWNSAAVVTEKTSEKGGYKAVAVVTKVDLLTCFIQSRSTFPIEVPGSTEAEGAVDGLEAQLKKPLDLDTPIMSSSRGLRRAAGQTRTFDESPLEHALRRSRRVAGEAPEAGPYRPPPRRPRHEASSHSPAQPEPQHHPPPPSSTFTFTRSDPPVPLPGFTPARLATISLDPTRASHPHPTVHSHPLMANNVNASAAIASAHSQRRPSPIVLIKIEDRPPKAEEKRLTCDICCEASEAPVIQPCRYCTVSYCGDCIRTMFLQATQDVTSMPPKCCSIFSTIVAFDFLTTAEADAYRLKFEEWVSAKKTYCPAPTCSRFIPDRAVLQPPRTDPISLWDLLKQELPAILKRLQQEDCARYVLNHLSPEAHGIKDWKEPRRMVWLEEITARLPKYSNMAEFTSDFQRLYTGGRSMPPQASVCADVLRRHLWKEIGKIKGQANSKFTKLPATACFSCPHCHIGICPSYDEDYSDEELDEELYPDAPPANIPPQGTQNVRATVPVPADVSTPASVTAPGNIPAMTNQSATLPAGTVRPVPSLETPIDLDARTRRDWEASGANFGDEPHEIDPDHIPIWSCTHDFHHAHLSEEAFKRGVPLGSECFRCFARTYATVRKPSFESLPKSHDAGKTNHKHTAEEDVAWRCDACEMLLCGVCKNVVESEQEL